MLRELHVENVAIIERAGLLLGPGMTVITGETGAGKSLLVDALQLALGQRADTELIRTGAERAFVRIVIDLPPTQRESLADVLGHDLPPGPVTIQRELLAVGRSVARVQEKTVTVAKLREFADRLVDLHGQHDHHSLLDPERHLELVDAWAGPPADDLRSEVAAAYAAREEADRRLRNLQAHLKDREERLHDLHEAIREIEAVTPREGEAEELSRELARLQNFERLNQAANFARSALGSAEVNARDQLAEALEGLRDAAAYDDTLRPTVERLEEALVCLDDGLHEVSRYADQLEGDPERLHATADRLDAIRRLLRKYGTTENEVMAYLEEARREADALIDADASLDQFRQALARAEQELETRCAALTRVRADAAREMGIALEEELRDLDMERARIAVEIRPAAPSSRGADSVEFLFSANLGEDPKPLAKIASGGELSRVMLAIKSGMAGRGGAPTLIFDEVDTGLGGRAARRVAVKLEGLARHFQVLVISHLPQIAARAGTHFRIEKVERGGRVVTELRPLSSSERVDELARMMVGEPITEAARQNARELLHPAEGR